MPKSTPRYKPHLIEMERCLIEGASTLLRAKHTYWPIEGSTEPHEANLVLHAAAAFTRAGHHAYAEVHPADAPNEQIDLVVIGTSDGTHWALAAEAKRLHSTEKARSLGEDTRRLRHTRLPNAEEELGSFVYVSCVLASC